MKTNSNAYMIVYVAVMGIAVSVLLTFVGRFTAPRKLANQEAEKIRNVLQVFGVAIPADASAAAIKQVFDRNVKAEERGGSLRYVYMPTGATAPAAVALDFSGPGLWGPIKGLLAFEPDMVTLRGITFYQQEETPGLGGDIATDVFTRRFPGRKIRTAAGATGLRIAQPGTATAENEVDGITGATMTCRKVESILNATIVKLNAEGGSR